MGLTVVADSVVVLPSTISVGQPLRQIEIQPIDCHPLDRSPMSVPFSYQERWLMERAIAKRNPILVTIPMTRGIGRSDWLRELQSESPKPGWIWLDELVTLSDYLLKRGLRSAVPPYPVDDGQQNQTQRPERRPNAGLTIPLERFGQMYEGPDSWTVRTIAGHELHIWLVDCYCVNKQAAYDFIWDTLNNCRTLSLTIPPPMSGTEDWIGELLPRSCHSGWIWIDEKQTINQLLLEKGFAQEYPF